MQKPTSPGRFQAKKFNASFIVRVLVGTCIVANYRRWQYQLSIGKLLGNFLTDGFEGGRIISGQIRKNLSVDFYFGFFKTVDKLGV